jgi:hypothetical protein
MAELKADSVKVAQKPTIDGEEMVYLSIPEEDIYDQTHPGVHLMGGSIKEFKDGHWIDTGKAGTSIKFEHGKTYLVPASIGAEVEKILEKFNKEQVRLLRPKADAKSLQQVNAGSLWAKGAVTTGDGLDNALAQEKGKVTTVNWS